MEWFNRHRNLQKAVVKKPEPEIRNYLLNGFIYDTVDETLSLLHNRRFRRMEVDLDSLFSNLQHTCIAMAQEFDFTQWPVNSLNFTQTSDFILFEWTSDKNNLSIDRKTIAPFEIATVSQIFAKLNVKWPIPTRLPIFDGVLYNLTGENTMVDGFLATQISGNPYERNSKYTVNLRTEEIVGVAKLVPQ